VQVLDLPEKNSPGENPLSYFVALSVTKQKRFVMLTPGMGCEHYPQIIYADETKTKKKRKK
jgi:hypothetical protein